MMPGDDQRVDFIMNIICKDRFFYASDSTFLECQGMIQVFCGETFYALYENLDLEFFMNIDD